MSRRRTALRVVAFVLLFAVSFAGFLLWARNREAAPGMTNSKDILAHPTPPERSEPPDANVGPGVEWTRPERWVVEPDRPMRLASYRIPAPDGGEDFAECAVHYFGPGQGGNEKLNLERWSGEFMGGAEPELDRWTAGGVKLTRARMRGTYLAHAGTDEDDRPRRDFTLLGAIVAGPNGPVFVKLVGPTPTVAAAEPEFDALLRSIHQAGSPID